MNLNTCLLVTILFKHWDFVVRLLFKFLCSNNFNEDLFDKLRDMVRMLWSYKVTNLPPLKYLRSLAFSILVEIQYFLIQIFHWSTMSYSLNSIQGSRCHYLFLSIFCSLLTDISSNFTIKLIVKNLKLYQGPSRYYLFVHFYWLLSR